MSMEPNRRSFIFGSAATLALLFTAKPVAAFAELVGTGDRILKQVTFSAGPSDSGNTRPLLVRLLIDDDVFFQRAVPPHHRFDWFVHVGMMVRGNQRLEIDVDRFDGDATASIAWVDCDFANYVRQRFAFKDGDRRAIPL